MTSLRAWLLRLAGSFGNQRRERDLADELEAHVLMHVEENLRAGMSVDEARRDARIKLGGIEQTKESYRARRGLPLLENFLRDLRFGARTLGQNPGFAVVAVLTLALGIGLNTSIFTILNGAAWRLLPVPHAEELVAVSQAYRKLQGPIHRNVRENASFFSYSEYTAYRDQNHVFSGLLAYAPFIEVNMGGAHPKHLIGALTSCNYFDVLEVTPTLGRGFTQAECIAGNAAPVVVLSDGLWRSAFGADASIIGKPVILNRIPFTVIGIAPPGFQGSEPIPSQFWAPVNLQSSLLREPDRLADDSQSWLGLLGRTKSGISAKQTRADLGVIAGQIDQRDPGRVTTVAIDTATLFSVPEERFVLLSMGGALLFAVSMVLLIACVNVASLLLARAAGRRKEIAVRLAMGASRERLIQQLFTESLLVALLAGLLGSLISFWSTTGLVRFLQSNISAGYWPVALNISPDVHVLAYALGLTLLTGIAFGLAPALQSSRADLACAMKGESADSGAEPRPRDLLRGALVAAQVAACMVLLLAAGLLLRGLHRAQTIDPGFRMKNVAAISLDLNGAGYDNHRAEALQRQLLQQIAALPGVNATAQASAVPLDDNHRATDLSIPGREEHVGVEYNYVSPGFFPLLGVPIVRGRNFTGAEGQTGMPVAILTESTARRLWPSEDPIGKTIHLDAADYAVVGVAKDAQVSFLGRSDNIYAYLPAGPKQQLDLRLLISGTGGSPTTQSLRATVAALDPELAVAIVNIEENLEPWLTPGRIFSILCGFLSSLALLLAAMGVYGLVSYVVSRRVREIGIRMALGADNRDVMALVLRKAMRPVVIGTLIGIAGCAAVAWALTTILPWDISLRFLYGISPIDPVAFFGVPGFLLGVAVLASYIPARRAMKVDPMVALRYE
jgi:macrolide transport system ATP-binding/permease protein